jgi:hypothetical protein
MDKQSPLRQLKGYDEAKAREQAEAAQAILGQDGGSSQRAAPSVVTARGSICIGCGCTDDFACYGSCSWLAVDYAAGVGVCSNCGHALPAWENGARHAAFLPEIPSGQQLIVQLDGRWVREYAPGQGQPEGTYCTVDYERGIVHLVDEQGRPAVARDGSQLRMTFGPDWGAEAKAKSASISWGRRSAAADAKRGRQLKTARGRERAKAAKKARQAARRRS